MNQSEEWLRQLARGNPTTPPAASRAQEEIGMEMRRDFLARVAQTTYQTDPVLAHHLGIPGSGKRGRNGVNEA